MDNNNTTRPAMSETPRTDSKVLLWNLTSDGLHEAFTKKRLGHEERDINGKLVPADFARELERALAAATAEKFNLQNKVDNFDVTWEQQKLIIDALRAQLAQANERADKSDKSHRAMFEHAHKLQVIIDEFASELRATLALDALADLVVDVETRDKQMLLHSISRANAAHAALTTLLAKLEGKTL